jgi:beta-galactosidase
MKKSVKLMILIIFGSIANYALAQSSATANKREHLLMDFDWRFAFGHPYDTQKDFNTGTGYFSYFAKTGYGDGAAAPGFDDRSWRKLDLPHDWAVEQPFSPRASTSHGFKAIGRNFPDASVGWYRKKFFVPASDLGRHITIAFDGVFRNSIVWVNGHYLGTELSGYNSFEYNITDYLNYGGDNVIAVRVDATMEEGWFYEGAGIYRHVWLNKTDPLHVATNGTFVSTLITGSGAQVNALAIIDNDDAKAHNFSIIQKIVDAAGDTVASERADNDLVKPYTSLDVKTALLITKVNLWSVDTPYLYKLVTRVEENGKVIDNYTTNFGARTISFDANKGFFLNGRHFEITGSDNHQDHAGVGTAIPDALQDFRIKTLKSFGCNTYRCSHNPPTPELLDACDRLGMLVIDENRQMGVSSTQLGDLKQLILRDRNHPCVISWSIGNEEWAIENTIVGARIATTMQNYALSIDSTRYITAAFSGGVGSGLSNVVQVLGYNYVANKNTDEHHKQYPNQYSWGTEEGATRTTRGVYFDDSTAHHLMAYDRKPSPDFISLEQGWKYYAARPYLAGMCIWAGFDYRGEPTPFGWPSIESYHGMVDACGFYKDDVWYLKSWWTKEPVVHLLPHWNWPGREGQPMRVVVYSNCDEVELFLNKKSLGKQKMPVNSHLEWQVPYTPGKLEAIGYTNGKKIASDAAITTGAAKTVELSADRTDIKANRQDVSMIQVDVHDKAGLHIPDADNEVYFTITGPGKIIGVGNGDNTSLEADKYLEKISVSPIENLKEKMIADFTNDAAIAPEYDDTQWQRAFKDERDEDFGKKVKAIVYRGSFTLPADEANAAVTYFYKSLGKVQSIYINGKKLGDNLPADKDGNEFKPDPSILHPGVNIVTIEAIPFIKQKSWDVINMDPGRVQLLYPSETWKRKLFNGLAQIIVQSTGAPGEIILTAKSGGLVQGELKIQAVK